VRRNFDHRLQSGKVKTLPLNFTKWDIFVPDLGKDATPRQLTQWFATTHKLTLDSIMVGNTFVWTAYPHNEALRALSAANMDTPFRAIFNRAHADHPLSEHARYLLADVSAGDDDGETVLVPPVKLRI
jgi:hypothetical protein